MTQPATGTTWSNAGLSDLESRFLERGKLVQACVRDARGTATDISPHNADGSVRWSPFAQDDTWRDDLFAFKRTNGLWRLNPDPNEGFHLVGAFAQGDGPTSSPSITNDDFMILQSNFPFDTDITEENEPFSFTAVETAKPLIRRLRNNLRLNADNGDVLVEEPGLPNAGWSRPLDADNPGRQVLLVREYRKAGLTVYTVDGYSLAKLSDLGESSKDKTDSEAAEMTYTPLPDGIFMALVDGEYRPVIKHTWVGGPGWAAILAAEVWVTATAYTAGDIVKLTGGEILRATVGGTSDAAEPTAPAVGATVTDSTVTWLRVA
ncbi:hypothetical protein BA059_16900 [Mycolicibacterium sp. (ex Dasyatis americana)]|nr:hypothetical protein BA059_16900 [Mycolicibacterium sp. (ex Dasyatis americana)]